MRREKRAIASKRAHSTQRSALHPAQRPAQPNGRPNPQPNARPNSRMPQYPGLTQLSTHPLNCAQSSLKPVSPLAVAWS